MLGIIGQSDQGDMREPASCHWIDSLRTLFSRAIGGLDPALTKDRCTCREFALTHTHYRRLQRVRQGEQPPPKPADAAEVGPTADLHPVHAQQRLRGGRVQGDADADAAPNINP